VLYHGDANGISFIKANGFVFYFAESPNSLLPILTNH